MVHRVMRRRYQTWGEFLKKYREERFRSAREFCARSSIGISYPQYSRYEAGDQLPSLELAIKLCKLLLIPVTEGLLEWNRAQVTDSELAAEIETAITKLKSGQASLSAASASTAPAPESSKLDLDDIIVFNRSHLKLFESNLAYRDIFTYINSYAPEWIAMEEISIALGIEPAKLETMLDQLSDIGVVLLAGGRCRTTKKTFYFPDDADFFALRNSNLMHNVTSILNRIRHEDIVSRQAYRGVITRELTAEQIAKVVAQLDDMASSVVGMPETSSPGRIFSLCMVMGERFARPKMGEVPGLRRSQWKSSSEETQNSVG